MAPHIIPRCISLIVTCLFLQTGVSQVQDTPKILSGIVRDAGTSETLPAVNIRVSGSTRGTTTNKEGAYRIEVPPGSTLLMFSCIGYRSDTVNAVALTGLRADIALHQTVLPLDEVTVLAEGQSPAESIIRKAIRKKTEADLGLKAYAFKAYTKTTLRVPQETEAGRDTIIAGLFETQSEGYWERPDHYKEIITARRQSANISPAQNVFSMGRLPNLNDNRTVIGQLSVVGPTSPEALDYYSFEMLDTLAIDQTRIFRLHMEPKSTTRPLFAGTIAIADGSFRVMQVDVVGNEALDVPPFENVHIKQQFSLYEDRYWLPIESSTDYLVHLSFPAMPPILWQQSSLVSDYEIGSSAQNVNFDAHVVSALPIADRPDSSLWSSSALLPLTLEEKTAYRKLDSLMTNAGILARSAIFLARLPVTLHALPLTDFSDLFHFNRVEGAYVGAGIDFSRFLGSTDASVSAGYGIADRKWKYGVRLEQFFSRARAFSLGGEFHRTTRYREGESIFSRGTITLLALVDKSDPVDYFLAEGFSLFSTIRPARDLSVALSYLDERQSSLTKHSDFSILRPSATFRANPPIEDGRYRMLTGTVRYDTRRFIDAGFAETLDESQDATLLSISAEVSGRGILKSPADYQRCVVEARRYLHAVGPGRLLLSASLGTSWGSLPPQRQFDVQAQGGGIAPAGAFKCAMTKEFAGDHVATLQIEYNFGVAPLRALGVSFLRNLELSVYSGTAWCDLNEWYPATPARAEGDQEGLFQEAGFGIGRILTFFKLDFTWRLTHRVGNNFSVTVGSAIF